MDFPDSSVGTDRRLNQVVSTRREKEFKEDAEEEEVWSRCVYCLECDLVGTF